MKLEGKVAVITGAASGIGKEIAKLYAQEGASVVISDLNEKGALEVVEKIEKDRKSTRLNSSHVAISYAVFCLKKKTTRQHTPAPRPRHTSGTHGCPAR